MSSLSRYALPDRFRPAGGLPSLGAPAYALAAADAQGPRASTAASAYNLRRRVADGPAWRTGGTRSCFAPPPIIEPREEGEACDMDEDGADVAAEKKRAADKLNYLKRKAELAEAARTWSAVGDEPRRPSAATAFSPSQAAAQPQQGKRSGTAGAAGAARTMLGFATAPSTRDAAGQLLGLTAAAKRPWPAARETLPRAAKPAKPSEVSEDDSLDDERAGEAGDDDDKGGRNDDADEDGDDDGEGGDDDGDDDDEGETCAILVLPEAVRADGKFHGRSQVLPVKVGGFRRGSLWEEVDSDYTLSRYTLDGFTTTVVNATNEAANNRGIALRYDLRGTPKTILMACERSDQKLNGMPKAGAQFYEISTDDDLRAAVERLTPVEAVVFTLRPSVREREALRAGEQAKADEAAAKAAKAPNRPPSTRPGAASAARSLGGGDESDLDDPWEVFNVQVYPLLDKKLTGKSYFIRHGLGDNPTKEQSGFEESIDNPFSLQALVKAAHDPVTFGQLLLVNGAAELSTLSRGAAGQVEPTKPRSSIASKHDLDEHAWRPLVPARLHKGAERGPGFGPVVRTLAIAVAIQPPPSATPGKAREGRDSLGGGTGYSGSRDTHTTSVGGAISARERAEANVRLEQVWRSMFKCNGTTATALRDALNFLCGDKDRLLTFMRCPSMFYTTPELTPNLFKHCLPSRIDGGMCTRAAR